MSELVTYDQILKPSNVNSFKASSMSVSNIRAISPYNELLAYEFLWAQDHSSLKKIAQFLSLQAKLPSEVVNEIPPDLFGSFDQRIDTIKEFIEK